MKPQDPGAVKLLAGILFSDEKRMLDSLELLSDCFGPIDFQSKIFTFDITGYYEPEMGSPIFRILVSFSKLILPSDLAHIKTKTVEIEEQLAVDGCRKVNLDPGYMDYDKIVLASYKYNGQKIYLDHGVWADLTLHYEKGTFHPYPWSFPDFKTGLYNDVFIEIRRVYKEQRKE